ncbi:MAG: NUDIX hydrolase [Patescibacteria group bacterium]
MREIERIIVSALIFSKDGKLLMGQKDPVKGGVYPDCWHIPGGGVDVGETLEQALQREVLEETGIDISNYEIVTVPFIDSAITEKTLKTGEVVLCKMEFNRFEIYINNKTAEEIKLSPTDDLVEIQWFDKKRLSDIKNIPGGKEFFQKMGYI